MIRRIKKIIVLKLRQGCNRRGWTKRGSGNGIAETDLRFQNCISGIVEAGLRNRPL
jgi:hypothetical protein